MIEIDEDTKARFWARVRKTETCWLWPSRFLPNGYGRYCIKRDRRRYDFLAHRFAWIAAHGEIPKGMFVLHRCDNPPCVRLDHLFLGTHADNMADMSNKGRSTQGIRATGVALSEADVLVIYEKYRSHAADQGELAIEFGVCRQTIGWIVTGKTWKHLGLEPVPRYRFTHIEGSRHGNSRLVEADVLGIRAAYTAGAGVKALALHYGVTHASISMIVHRKTWRHI